MPESAASVLLAMPVKERLAAPADVTVETACPLDCPDGCSLVVSVREGRIVEIDGSSRNPSTRGYICAKVRKFDQRVYGDSRLRYPMVRTGPKGSGRFSRISWDEAIEAVAQAIERVRDTSGAESILPFCYGGSNGLMTQDATDMVFFRRLGTSRLLRTVCAAPTGAANMGLYGKMPSITYLDYPHAKLIVMWGMNPSASGIHALPFIKQAQKDGATLVVIDPRTTPLARSADLHLAVRPGTDLPVALALHRVLFEEGRADLAFLDEHTTGASRLRARAAEWTIERAAAVAGVPPDDLRRFADLYAATSPALVRCGWGLERNRNGGSAAAAVLALPAVAGKFGVRGGGYAMSNSASWGFNKPWLDQTPEPDTRAINMNHLGRVLTEPLDPPVNLLFVYNCNPAATMPDQARVLKGLEREDLFTVVFEQVMNDTAVLADVILPATTFVEGYDFSRAYGPISLQLSRPVIDPVGEARSNADVFSDLGRRLGLFEDHEPHGELDTLLTILGGLPESIGEPIRDTGAATAPWNGAPIQFVDVFPRTADRKVHLYPDALDREAPLGLYGFQPDPGTDAFPLALISPASERTISSTLGELPRPEVKLLLHPDDARCRGLEDDDEVRVWNAGGEVVCRVQVGAWTRPGTAVLPKGLWRRHTLNGLTANALAPDSLSDLGGGACFNDARVQVAKR
jgi:anaerobic selenocysteine-containing dehydrogenase